jgi:hypothetical protein
LPSCRDLDHDATEAVFIGMATNAIYPAIVPAIVGLLSVCVHRYETPAQSFVEKLQRAALDGTGPTRAAFADVSRISGHWFNS